jgi:Flp pilus assembly protein TadB
MSSTLANATGQAFWSSTLALALVVAACAVVVGVSVALMLARRSNGRGVRERVGEFVTAARSAPDGDLALDQPASGMMMLAERSLERERWWDELKEKLEIARIDRSASEVVYLTLACSLVAAVLLGVLVGSPLVGLAALILIPVAARNVIDKRLRH